MDEMDEILLKAEIDEITKRIADTMKRLENLDIDRQENSPENKDQ
jgi:hypothetical protein